MSQLQPHLRPAAAPEGKPGSGGPGLASSHLPEVQDGLQGELKVGTPLTADEQSALDAAREAVRNSVPVANDIMGKVLAVDAALIGGGVIIAKGDVFPTWWAAVVMAPLLISFACALWGLMPRRGRLNLTDLAQLMDTHSDTSRAVRRKSDALFAAVLALFSALILAFVGVVLRSLSVL
jgi:hypothetical protein